MKKAIRVRHPPSQEDVFLLSVEDFSLDIAKWLARELIEDMPTLMSTDCTYKQSFEFLKLKEKPIHGM